MSQSVSQLVSHSTALHTGPQGAELRTEPRNLCTDQYTKKNDHTTREAFDKAYAHGMCIFLTSSVPEMLYARWEHEVAALKPQKRKAWKGHVSDTFGQKTVVVYCEDGISIPGRAFVSHYKHRLCGQKKGPYRTEDDWRVVIPIGLPYSDFGPDGKLALHAQQENVTGAADLADMPLLDQLATMHAEREANLTGAHRPKNHHISVPTTPGQPTRG